MTRARASQPESVLPTQSERSLQPTRGATANSRSLLQAPRTEGRLPSRDSKAKIPALARYLKDTDEDKTDDLLREEDASNILVPHQLNDEIGVKDETKFNTIFGEYLTTKDVIDFTDDKQANEDDDNCSLSIYTNRRIKDAKGSRASSIQEDHIIQGEEANIFVDFDEFLTGVNAKQFKTYDNSPNSDLIIMENCLDSEDGENQNTFTRLNRHLEGKINKKNLGRSSSRDGGLTPPFKLVHALSKVSNLTEGNTSTHKAEKNPSSRPFVKKPNKGVSKQSFIKNQIKALLDFHVQRQGLPIPGKKAQKK